MVLILAGCTLPTLQWNQPQIEGTVLPASLGGMGNQAEGWELAMEAQNIDGTPHLVLCLYGQDMGDLQALEVAQVVVPRYSAPPDTSVRDQEMAQHQQLLDQGEGERQRIPINAAQSPSETPQITCTPMVPTGQPRPNIQPRQVVTVPLADIEDGQMIVYRAGVGHADGQPTWSGSAVEVRDGKLIQYLVCPV
jgi:hypothetical protein